MTEQIVFTAITGILFLVAILIIACFIAFRDNLKPIPVEAMFIFRVILAVAASGFATALTGFVEIDGQVLKWHFRAAGSLAIFIAVYMINPPTLVGHKSPRPKRPKKITVPYDRLKNEKD